MRGQHKSTTDTVFDEWVFLLFVKGNEPLSLSVQEKDIAARQAPQQCVLSLHDMERRHVSKLNCDDGVVCMMHEWMWMWMWMCMWWWMDGRERVRVCTYVKTKEWRKKGRVDKREGQIFGMAFDCWVKMLAESHKFGFTLDFLLLTFFL